MVPFAMMAAIVAALLASCGGDDAAGAVMAREGTDRTANGNATAAVPGAPATAAPIAGSQAAVESQEASVSGPSSSLPADIESPLLAADSAPPAPVTTAPLTSPVEALPQGPSRTPPPAYVGPMNLDLKAIVDAALADAAKRTGLAVSALVVVSAEAVVWADGSLGCPAPGMSYTMALVPGHRVRIRAGSEVLDYHAGGWQLMLCPAHRGIDPLPSQTS